MTSTPRNLTIASLVCGSLGLILFVVYKIRGAGKNTIVNYGSKGLIALGMFLLAFAVLDMNKEPFCASYCSTAHDPDSNPWSYKTFCGPPPS